MNAQHSSKSNEWYTPLDIVTKAQKVLGTIDLDPASSELANKNIQAKKIFTIEDDALKQCWQESLPITVFMNSPGGKVGNKSQAGLFWEKLVDLREKDRLAHAIVIAFNLEQLRVTQQYNFSMTDFTFCIPKQRMRFVSPTGEYSSPTHPNAIIYVSGLIDYSSDFANEFWDVGAIVEPY